MYVLVFNRAYFSFKASSVAVSIRLQSISYTINCILHTLPLSCVYMFRVDFVLLCCHLISYATNHSTNSHFMVMQWIQSNCTFVYSFHILFTVIWLYELRTKNSTMKDDIRSEAEQIQLALVSKCFKTKYFIDSRRNSMLIYS